MEDDKKPYVSHFYHTMAFTEKLWGLTENHFWKQCVIDTAVIKIGDLMAEYHREFEAIFAKALTRESGA
jgi:hypothetical protein